MSKRVIFDFDISFTNGGGIQGQEFRLDIGGESISDKELADYIVWDMRLLMVGKVKIINKRYIVEEHKRSPISLAQGEELIDLSHTVFDGLVTYKGLPAPVICDYLSREQSKEIYEKGVTVQIGRIDMVANTGTYIDCPFHFFEEGTDLSEVPLNAFTGLNGITIEAKGVTEIGIDFFKNKEIRNKAVLVHSGWATNWNTEAYFTDHPYVTKEAAEYLRECDVKLVGIDSHNIDDTRGKARPVHSTLLGADILIVEHMCNLDMLPAAGYTFHAVPPKVKGMGTFPVRAYAKL
ncbi:cyclase family protein [Imperialibacter roseus]|uniref:Cyclase family protein n=1 Tax=Imperialibacter roseus TaxID=1324217 RepID=A0ABZ0IU40_9BACT|nr:cyclase family protein [Imperialibacter roseus]WOK07929.1 cyclase family protein [Imperialibacter roseus]|tara:strand:- start:87458 stop:88333 length:876 start_codon:yes stop_codon:yes gene_type:complete